MKPRQNWLYLVVFLFIISLILVACERPLPGGYNDPDAAPDSAVPAVPENVPEVAPSEAYPAAPAEAEPAAPAEGYPAEGESEDQGLTAEDEPAGDESAPDAEQTEPEEAPAADAPEAEDTAGEAEAPAEEDAAENPGTHTVLAGENLYRISLLYGLNWVDLAAANGITDPAGLSVGQVLIIPLAGSETEAEVAEEEPEEVEEGEQAADTPQEEAEAPGTYTVQAGDTLNKIGALLGVDWTEIVTLNDIIGTQIYAGQVLIVPIPADSAVDSDTTDTIEPTGEETTYVVEEGDSIYSVAFNHNILWTILAEANSLEAPYTLELGQTLISPAGE